MDTTFPTLVDIIFKALPDIIFSFVLFAILILAVGYGIYSFVEWRKSKINREVFKSFSETEWDKYHDNLIKSIWKIFNEKYDLYPKGTVVAADHEHKAHTFSINHNGDIGYVTLPGKLLEQIWGCYQKANENKENSEDETDE